MRSLLAAGHGEVDRLTAERDQAVAARDAGGVQAQAAVAAASEASKVAARNLEAAHLAADQFFGGFLEAARQLPAEGERSRLFVSGYEFFSRFLELHAADPVLAESCLRARCHLAEIKLAMGGGADAADKFDEARRHIEEFLVRNPQHPEARDFQLRAADCALNAAQIRLQAGQASDTTLGALDPALAALESLVRTDGGSPTLERRVAQGEMMLAQCQMSRLDGDIADAARRAQHAADLMNRLLADPRHVRPEDKLLLARAYFLRGQCERSARSIEPALASQVEAAQLLLECGDASDALFLLAQCYGETGEMLAANGEVRDAARAHGEAVKLLGEMVRRSPERADWRFALARRYADVAQLVRDHSQPARALDYQRGAVELVKSLLDREPGNPTYAASLARLKADLSDLLSSVGQKPEALAQANEAIALLDKLGMPGPPGSNADVDLRVSIARTYGLAGHVAEDANQLTQAQDCFSKAVAQYETVSALRAGDDALERDLTWSRMRLAKLKP
jgi:tetratricopeptide (TPR) repeat protein